MLMHSWGERFLHCRYVVVLAVNYALVFFCFSLVFGAQPQTTKEQLLPRSIEKAGWQMSGDPYSYSPKNLYSYIDGAADLFITYGFIKLQGAEYVDKTDKQESMAVDIYDMGAKLSAFGIFNSKRDPGSVSLNIGAGSFGNEQFVVFYKDRFYVEIQPRISRGNNKTLPLIMAQQVAACIPGDCSQPGELRYFPEKARVPGSENYIVGGILGHAFLPRGIICDYTAGQETAKAFIGFFAYPEETLQALKQYKKYLNESGMRVGLITGYGEEGFTAQEPFHKTVVVVRQGCFVAGISELSSIDNGKPLLRNMVDTIKKPSKSCKDLNSN